uniref:Tetratricopeptide repeat protein n=1 Tax=Schlesneria paludicola TaxID=360056 RepID=A0A7C4LLT1_9PLAN
MKSEHRHELQQNELGKLTRKLLPWFEEHGMQVVWGLIAVLLVAGGAMWWTSTATSAGAAGWTKLARLSGEETPDELTDVADKYGDTLAGVWARLRTAELNLENGVLAAFSDRELALADLERAKNDFEKVLAAKVDPPENVKQRALLGLARTLEALCDGDTAPVIEAYERLLKQYPQSIYKEQVERRIKELKSPSAREFYAWFHAQKPKPPEFRKPQDGPAAQDATSNLPPGPGSPPMANAPK